MTSGAMALYEAPSAAGPFRLIECATGGSLSAGLATLETRSFTPGNKLYLRVWDKLTRASTANFTLCVQGQTAPLASRGAGETACSATPIAATTLTALGSTNIDYVFAQEESGWLFTDSSYVGGDLWLSLTVPPSGVVRFAVARGSASGGTLNSIGISAYTSPACAAPDQFRQVGAFTSLPTSFPTGANWQINCLEPGETLYLRIHSTLAAQNSAKRYGRFRIAWQAGGAMGTPPTNNQPCGATPLAFNVSCPVTPAGGNNFNACSTPGIPLPGCGGFGGSSYDVWYSFVAPTSGTVMLEATAGTGAPADPAMALYTTGGNGCNGRFTLIQCDSRNGPGNSARIIRTGLVPGETYYVRAWAEGAGATGTFDICITEPIPPAGSCFYLINLWPEYHTPNGTQHMDVTINGGATTTYSTAPGDLFEQFLISVPTGASVFFEYYNVGVSWRCYREVQRLGDATPLWSTFSGGAVAGPTPPPEYTFTMNNACAPLIAPSTDCLGSRTICTAIVSGSNTVFGHVTGADAPGNRYDLAGANMGCLGTENNGIEWLIFRPVSDGTVAFWFDGTTNAPNTDLDFAVWDAGLAPYAPTAPHISEGICAPNGPPLRCSAARRNYSTGLQPGLVGVEQEGAGGWGWLSPLPVQADHVYLVAVVKVSSANAAVQYQMRWTMYTDLAGAPDPGMLDCTPMILPVEFLGIDARPIGRTVEVTWSTASERDNSHFVVERSSDGSTFSPIGIVEGAGTSTSRRDYRFLDEAPKSGLNYYRVQQVDFDGAFAHSNVVVALIDAEDKPVLYPNPSTGHVELLLHLATAGDRTVVISDATGRIVHTERVGLASGAVRHSMDLAALPAGLYHVQVMAADGGNLGSARLVKQ